MLKYYPDIVLVNIENGITASAASKLKKLLDRCNEPVLVLFANNTDFLLDDKNSKSIEIKQALKSSGISNFSWLSNCKENTIPECIIKYLNNKAYSRFIVIDKNFSDSKYKNYNELKSRCVRCTLSTDKDVRLAFDILDKNGKLKPIDPGKSFMYTFNPEGITIYDE